ncbi:odorant-binding protein 2b [Dugong dugon]
MGSGSACPSRSSGRNLDVNMEALIEFEEFMQSKGFTQGIFTPAQTESSTADSEYGGWMLLEHTGNYQSLGVREVQPH